MLKQNLWITLGFFVVLLLSCAAGLLSVVLFLENVNAQNGTSERCTTNLVAPIVTSDPMLTVQAYYNALGNKDYAQACGYFDPQGTIGKGKSTHAVSIELLRSLDAKRGVLKSNTIVDASFSSTNRVTVTMTITRAGQKQAYTVHLFLEQKDDTWKIINVDSL